MHMLMTRVTWPICFGRHCAYRGVRAPRAYRSPRHTKHRYQYKPRALKPTDVIGIRAWICMRSGGSERNTSQSYCLLFACEAIVNAARQAGRLSRGLLSEGLHLRRLRLSRGNYTLHNYFRWANVLTATHMSQTAALPTMRLPKLS